MFSEFCCALLLLRLHDNVLLFEKLNRMKLRTTLRSSVHVVVDFHCPIQFERTRKTLYLQCKFIQNKFCDYNHLVTTLWSIADKWRYEKKISRKFSSLWDTLLTTLFSFYIKSFHCFKTEENEMRILMNY